MFFQTPESGSALQTVANVIWALAPAFAIGVGVQRLVEILDSWLSLDTTVGKERKTAILAFASFAVGLAIAFGMKLKVIAALGGPDMPYLDYIISGLIISAGTEGFNSIIKWLLYSKEGKKAEAATERAQSEAVRRESIRRTYSFPGFSTPRAEVLTEDIRTDDPEADLRTVLHDVIKKTWPKKFVEAGWDGRPFSVFEAFPDKPKIVVGDSTRMVAEAYGKELKDSAVASLQDLVEISTKPSEILPEMLNVLLLGQKPKKVVTP